MLWSAFGKEMGLTADSMDDFLDQGAAETQDPGSYCMDLNEANKKAWTLERKKSFFKNENK
jgi:hypothetical protein